MIGIAFLPILAVFGWLVDLIVLFNKGSASFSIKDVRGILLWHLRYCRPYNHLRMLEHAMAFRMFKNSNPKITDEYIVDIGAEKSCFAFYLAKCGYRVIILDLDASQVKWQQSLYHKHKEGIKHPMTFIIGSATDLPFKEDSINVFAISVIEHIKQDYSVFQEIGRVIGQDHAAIISFLYQDTPLTSGQAKAAWNRAREYHPAYGAPRSIDNYILMPSRAQIES
jgi:ubiquinone/menaquinone biosynthesis C-methylase UbiE